MVDVVFVGQLVDAMGEAVEKLEQTIGSGGELNQQNKVYANQLRVFILEVYKKIEEALSQVG